MADIIKKKDASDSGRPKEKPSSETAPISGDLIFDFVRSQVKENVAQAKNEILTEFTSHKEEVEKKIKTQEDNKISIIEALAVFVALFTFVSVNITIFSKIEFLAAGIWFMILMAICQTLILTVFLIFLKKTHQDLKSWYVPMILIVLLLLLLWITLTNDKLNLQINPQNVESKAPISEENNSHSVNQNLLTLPDNAVINITTKEKNLTQASVENSVNTSQ